MTGRCKNNHEETQKTHKEAEDDYKKGHKTKKTQKDQKGSQQQHSRKLYNYKV